MKTRNIIDILHLMTRNSKASKCNVQLIQGKVQLRQGKNLSYTIYKKKKKKEENEQGWGVKWTPTMQPLRVDEICRRS